jgi:TonB family protein
VGADGRVREVDVDHATNDAFGEAAKAALGQWKFKAAQKGGVPVNCRVSQPLVFAVDKKGSVDWF